MRALAIALMTLALALPAAAANDVAKAPQAASAVKSIIVDLNRASLDELKALIKGATRRINGGYNGLDNRINYYMKAKLVL